MTDQPPYKRQKKQRTPLIINFFEHACPNHQNAGIWTHPKDESLNYKNISYWTKLAKLAEAGKVNAIFIGDVLGAYDVYEGPRNLTATAKSATQFPTNDPSAYVSAMAAVTTNLSFGVTFSTISENPYHFARRLATLDHLTQGRVGWNVVTSYLESAARNLLNGGALDDHEERYKRADEYVHVVYELLLSSWRDDAVTKDLIKREYIDARRIREINFKGDYFTVPGPQITEPSPQRLPLLIQAGSSTYGQELGAKIGELIFTGGHTPEFLKERIDSVKKIAKEKYNRDPDSLKFVSGIQVILGKTHQEAVDKYHDLLKYSDPEGVKALIGGWTGIDLSKYTDDEDLRIAAKTSEGSLLKMLVSGATGPVTKNSVVQAKLVSGAHPLFVGTAKEVADTLENWVDISGIDGFNFAYSIWPGSFEDIVELLIPELRRRGLAWDDYPVNGGTFRENFYGVKGQSFVPKDHSAYGYRWKKGVPKEYFEYSLDSFKEKWNNY